MCSNYCNIFQCTPVDLCSSCVPTVTRDGERPAVLGLSPTEEGVLLPLDGGLAASRAELGLGDIPFLGAGAPAAMPP